MFEMGGKKQWTRLFKKLEPECLAFLNITKICDNQRGLIIDLLVVFKKIAE